MSAGTDQPSGLLWLPIWKTFAVSDHLATVTDPRMLSDSLAHRHRHICIFSEEDGHVSTILVPPCGSLGPRGSARGTGSTSRPTRARELSARGQPGLQPRGHAQLQPRVHARFQPQLL